MESKHTPAQPWVCPWGICNHTEAQQCRAEMRVNRGCGGRFPADMSPAQAAMAIKAPPSRNEEPR